jgi:D-alanyl-D-alanine carboxypeptidase
MTTNRRDLIAAGAAFVLPGKAAWPFRRHKTPAGCHGRAAYGGGPLRAQIAAAEFDAAARAGTGRAGPLASDDLDNRLEKAAKSEKSLGFTAAIARSDRVLWTQTGATAGPAPSPLTFEWPGLAEACVATAVLQLAEEGKLTLETTIERWAPEIPTAQWITVEDLLSHTSGLADPVQAGGPPTAAYCPGAGWARAETDDRLLARILGAADGRSVHDALAQRIVERLELKETTTPPDLAAGAITASSADVVRIWRAVLGGGLQGADMARRRFQRLYPMTAEPARTHWGLGVMVSDLAADRSNPADVWLGVSRARPGASAAVAYSLRKHAFAAVALTGPGSAEEVIDLLLLGVQADPAHVDLTAPAPPAVRRGRRRRPKPKAAAKPTPTPVAPGPPARRP